MKQLRLVKNASSFLAVSLILLGLVLLFLPKTTMEMIAKIFGIILGICGMIKVLGYFTKDRFHLNWNQLTSGWILKSMGSTTYS